MKENFHTISILVINEAGVLSRIVDLFSGRGYNIESLTVAPTLDKNYSRVTIVTLGDAAVIEQINKQLNRLIPVCDNFYLNNKELIIKEMENYNLISSKMKRILDIKVLKKIWSKDFL